MRKLAALSIVAMAIGLLAGTTFLHRNYAGLLKPDDLQVVGRGEVVYAEHCASCHGPNLEGQPDWQTRNEDGFMPAPPHNESGHTWHHPDKLLIDITKLGLAEAANLRGYKTRMPAFGPVLDDNEIVAVLSYLKSRWPKDVQKRHDELNLEFERRERFVK